MGSTFDAIVQDTRNQNEDDGNSDLDATFPNIKKNQMEDEMELNVN